MSEDFLGKPSGSLPNRNLIKELTIVKNNLLNLKSTYKVFNIYKSKHMYVTF